MTITKLVPVTRGRTKVYIDETYYFALYGRELHQYGIKDGQLVSEELVDRILSQVILKRAKLRAMNLLKQQDRTIADLRNKLKQSFYREDIIDLVITYLDGYHYVDDYRYCVQFITFKRGTLSCRQMKYKLLEKGVDGSIIDAALDSFEDTKEEEEEALKKALVKKIRNKDVTSMDKKEWDKVYRFLLNKGFSSSLISRQIKDVQSEDYEF